MSNTVMGRRIDFDNGRIVFLGENEARPDTAYVAFRNAEGHDLYLKMSWEALDALVELRRDPTKGGEPSSFPHKPREVISRWQQVIPLD